MERGESGEEDGEDWSLPADSFMKGPTGDAIPAVPESKNGHQRTIVHIDVDCFYAQVEMIRNPSLRDVPLGVQQKYLVVTCNYPARARGVTKLMGVMEAKKKCPELVLVSGEELTHYREMSYKISEFLLKYTPNVERLGFDENYLDVTEMVRQRIQGSMARTVVEGHTYCPKDLLESDKAHSSECPCGCHFRLAVGSQIAVDIRSAMNVELGVTCCAGVAHNKVLAKLVGSVHKPNQQTTLFPGHALALVTGLPSAHSIPGVGWASSKRLRNMGVVTVTDLQQFPLSQLEEEFGDALATTMHCLSFGVDDSPVIAYSRPQTLSVEDSFRRCSSEADARSRVSQLMESLLPRVREDGRTPHTLRLTVRRARKEDRYLHRESRQCSVPASVFSKVHAGRLDSAKEALVPMAMALFHKMVDTKQPFHLNLINVAFAKLEEHAVNSIANFLSSPSKSHHPMASSLLKVHSDQSPESSSQKSSQAVSESYIKLLDDDDDAAATQRNSNAAETSTGSADRQGNQKLLGTWSPATPKENVAKTPSSSRSNEGTKRHTQQLPLFFSKKRRLMDNSGKSELGGEREMTVSAPDTVQNTSPSVHADLKEIPSDIDPSVFSQLPTEIQQEILHSAAPLQGQLSLEMQSESSLKKHDASSCKSDRNVYTRVELQPVKKQLFKVNGPHKGKQQTLRVLEDGKVRTNTHIHKQASAAVYSQRDACEPIQLKEPLSDSLSACTSEASEHGTNTDDTAIGKTEPACSREFPLSGSSLRTTSITSVPVSGNETPSGSPRVSSTRLSWTDLPVPQGIAPDVFYALPPEIQREVAAEMAMQRLKVRPPDSQEAFMLSSGQRKVQTSKNSVRGGKTNSLLNYIKRK